MQDKMQVVPLGAQRVKQSEIKDYKSDWQHVHYKVNIQGEGIQNNDKKRRKKKNKIGIQK